MRRKVSAVIIAICIVFLNCNTVDASVRTEGDRIYREVEKNVGLSKKYKEAINYVQGHGYTKKQIYDLSLDTIYEMSEALKEDPSSVELSNQIYVFDEMQSVEIAVNLSEKELVEQVGVSRSKAKEIKNREKELRKMSDAAIKKKYNMSNAEICVLRNALVQQDNYKPYKQIEDAKKVTLSSTISSSKLSVSQLITNNSQKKNGKRINSKYKVTESFNWIKCYYDWDMTDTLGVAWSGGYTYKTSSKKINYYKVSGVWPAYKWGKSVTNTKNAATDGTPSVGCKYSFSQRYSLMSTSFAKSGKIVLNLSQNGYQGKKAQIISKYCHKRLALGGVNITSAPAIAVTVTTSYDCTDTDRTNNIIYY